MTRPPAQDAGHSSEFPYDALGFLVSTEMHRRTAPPFPDLVMTASQRPRASRVLRMDHLRRCIEWRGTKEYN